MIPPLVRRKLIVFLCMPLLLIGCRCGTTSIDVPAVTASPTPSPSPSTPVSAPTGLSYSPNTKTGYVGAAITSLTPTVTGSDITYSISPALPAGLTLDTSTGVISGTPAATLASTVYTITATNSGGNTTATVTLVMGLSLASTSTGNGGDSNVGDGICDNGSGQCTLRAAIEEANAGTVPAKIVLPDGTYNLGGTPITITATVDLSGTTQAGTILDGGGTSRVINSTSLNLAVSNLTIQNGSGGSTATSQGGGIKHVRFGGALSLDHVTMTGNQTNASDSGGGAVYSSGSTVNITNSVFSNNSQTQATGGNLGGGALFINSGSISTISLSQFSNNTTAGTGGALEVKNTTLTVSDSTFSTNTSTGFVTGGGAIFSEGGINLYRNLLKNNTATMGAGGALVISGSAGGKIENNTFYGNNASSGFGFGQGGAIYVATAITVGTLFSHNTIVGNLASTTGGGYYCANCIAGADRFKSNIISGNTNGNCAFAGGGVITSQGYNLDSANTCAFASTGDLINTDPLVVAGAPVNNGGVTDSIALQAGSPARDAATLATCPTTDQRGVARPANGQCDIGAYEY